MKKKKIKKKSDNKTIRSKIMLALLINGRFTTIDSKLSEEHNPKRIEKMFSRYFNNISKECVENYAKGSWGVEKWTNTLIRKRWL